MPGPFEVRDAQQSHDEHQCCRGAEHGIGAQQAPRLRHRQRRPEERHLDGEGRDQRKGRQVVQEGHEGGGIHGNAPCPAVRAAGPWRGARRTSRVTTGADSTRRRPPHRRLASGVPAGPRAQALGLAPLGLLFQAPFARGARGTRGLARFGRHQRALDEFGQPALGLAPVALLGAVVARDDEDLARRSVRRRPARARSRALTRSSAPRCRRGRSAAARRWRPC